MQQVTCTRTYPPLYRLPLVYNDNVAMTYYTPSFHLGMFQGAPAKDLGKRHTEAQCLLACI